MSVDVTSIPPAPPPPVPPPPPLPLPVPPPLSLHQPTLTVVCSVEKDRLPKLKKLVKTDLHTYQLYKVIGESSSYGIVYESETEDGWIS
ncbi:hypothetical protein QQG55_1470 [Brugia pahangi]